MTFHPFSVTIPHVAYACLGGFVVLFGMFSLFIREKLYIGEAIWAFVFGVVIGPYGANIFNPRGWAGETTENVNTITLEVTRVILAIGVFSIGVELPKAYMARHWKSLFFLLLPCMTWGWFVCAGLIFALIPGLNFRSSLVVAACLTPTDPILAAAVVGGKYADKHVPIHLRHLLAAESGCNDGAAFPFLFAALYFVLNSDPSTAVEDWFLITWLYQIILGTVFGSVIGFAFRHLMKFCERKDLIDRQSYVAQYVSLAMFTIGATTMLGSDDLLACFACGSAFAWDGFFNKQTEASVFSSVIDLLFNVAAFVFIGAWMPFNTFSDADLTLSVWRLLVIGILVLLLRRLPIVVALYRWIPDIKTLREAVFSGHFGPMGVGAVFISTLAAMQLPEPESPPANQTQLLAASIQPIVAFMVLCSIAVHGLSIPFFSLGRRVHSVSRTWSRHTSREVSGPEWTQQTTHVVRGEDIVINRDSALERGELTKHDTLESDKTLDKEAVLEDRQQRSTDWDRVSAHPEDHPEHGRLDSEQPPDGENTEVEWIEGSHKVIERRGGPGEEVEVEVVPNFTSNADGSKIFRGEEGHVRQAVGQYMDRMRGALEGEARREKEHVEDGFEHAKQNLRDAIGTSDAPENEETGRSEQSEAEGDGGAAAGAVDKEQWPRGRKRSKRSGAKPVTVVHGKSSTRRRPASANPSLPPTPPPGEALPGPSSAALLESHEERRGRRMVSARNSRIDTLRLLDSPRHSRASSPARSVHWADDPTAGGSGTLTPRSPTSFDFPSPPAASGSEDPAADNTVQASTPSKVMFHLPDHIGRK